MSIRQPASCGAISFRHIASEYGSCPVEAAAHQIRMRRWPPRAAISAGMMVSRKCSNGILSRKKNDSLVVIASTTSTASACAFGSLQPLHQIRQAGQPVPCARPAAAGFRPGTACRPTARGRSAPSAACAEIVVEGCHERISREQANDLRRDLVERQHGGTESGIRDRARHAPDHARFLVLRDDGAAGRDDGRRRRACRRSPFR